MIPQRLACLVVVASVSCRSSSHAPAPAALDVHVDRRVELLSIVERLSGAPEYQTAPRTTYASDVDRVFGPFANHPAVAAARALRTDHGISYDAPMNVAINLDASLHLQRTPDDARFNGVDLEPFVAQLRDFADQSGFDKFVASHRDYYTRVEERFRSSLEREKPDAWFDKFFGKGEHSRFVVVPGLLTGTWNFGPHTDDERYQIVGLSHVDFDDLPVVDNETLVLTVHEMAHSYVNPIVASHRSELAASGERLFVRVQDVMKKQAYTTWEIFIDEQLVRAVTALYTRERRGVAAADAQIADEEKLGFTWTRPLVDKMEAGHASFTSQVPELVRFFVEAQ